MGVRRRSDFPEPRSRAGSSLAPDVKTGDQTSTPIHAPELLLF